jgi:hypothetical protein
MTRTSTATIQRTQTTILWTSSGTGSTAMRSTSSRAAVWVSSCQVSGPVRRWARPVAHQRAELTTTGPGNLTRLSR